jgi:hypothetical protein
VMSDDTARLTDVRDLRPGDVYYAGYVSVSYKVMQYPTLVIAIVASDTTYKSVTLTTLDDRGVRSFLVGERAKCVVLTRDTR